MSRQSVATLFAICHDSCHDRFLSITTTVTTTVATFDHLSQQLSRHISFCRDRLSQQSVATLFTICHDRFFFVATYFTICYNRVSRHIEISVTTACRDIIHYLSRQIFFLSRHNSLSVTTGCRDILKYLSRQPVAT